MFQIFDSLWFNCESCHASGNVQRLDLTGHKWDYKPEHASLSTEFVYNGKPILILPPSSITAAPYDHDP